MFDLAQSRWEGGLKGQLWPAVAGWSDRRSGQRNRVDSGGGIVDHRPGHIVSDRINSFP